MYTSLAVPALSLLSLASLANGNPVELLGRNNDGGGKYKSKCQGFRVTGIENVVQVGQSTYWPQGTSLNFTSLQNALVSSEIPSFCRE